MKLDESANESEEDNRIPPAEADENENVDDATRSNTGEESTVQIIVDECANEKGENSSKKWIPPKKKADKDVQKLMLAEYISILIKVLMNNNVYKFGGKLRIQSGTGSTGDRVTPQE